jgi:hypothetical protein
MIVLSLPLSRVVLKVFQMTQVVTCPHVAAATDISLFRFGIAFFVKVCLLGRIVPSQLDTDVLSDELFICDSCDMEGAPDLIRASGEHTEEHHLIRCLAPERAEEAPSSLEKRLDDMQSQFNDLSGRMGNIEQLLHRLAARIG